MSGTFWAKRPKPPLHVRLVLRALLGRADAHRLAERVVDLGRVVRGSIVEQHRDRRLAGGLDGRGEGLAHRGAVLLIRHRDADGRAGRWVDDELEVHAQDLAVDHHLERLAVGDPLRAGEEGLEGVATRAPRRRALAVLEEDARDERVAEPEPVLAAHVLAEGAESPGHARHAVSTVSICASFAS